MKQHNALHEALDKLCTEHGYETVIDVLGDVCDERSVRARRAAVAHDARPYGLAAIHLWGAARGLSVPLA
jgi:hypothetical protein